VLAHKSNRESKGPARNSKNQMLRFGKLDYLVLSGPTADNGNPSSSQVVSDLMENKNHDKPKRLWRWLQDLIEEKMESKENLGKTMA
jgi:hypothetical protein